MKLLNINFNKFKFNNSVSKAAENVKFFTRKNSMTFVNVSYNKFKKTLNRRKHCSFLKCLFKTAICKQIFEEFRIMNRVHYICPY